MGVTIEGLERLQGKLARAKSGALQDDLVHNLHAAANPIIVDMDARAQTRIQRRAMDSVKATPLSNGIEIDGGRPGGLGEILFAGGEFGGRKGRKVSYATHSPNGRPYRVRRRTTMQFLPHLGREGYFFWPTIREWMPKLLEQSEQIVAESLGD